MTKPAAGGPLGAPTCGVRAGQAGSEAKWSSEMRASRRPFFGQSACAVQRHMLMRVLQQQHALPGTSLGERVAAPLLKSHSAGFPSGPPTSCSWHRPTCLASKYLSTRLVARKRVSGISCGNVRSGRGAKGGSEGVQAGAGWQANSQEREVRHQLRSGMAQRVCVGGGGCCQAAWQAGRHSC